MRSTIIWTFRAALLSAVSLMIYVALLPAYNFSPWVPDRLLLAIGTPISLVDLLQFKADKITHLFGAYIVVTLGLCSIQTPLRRPSYLTRAVTVLLLICITVVTEIAQLAIGRHFSVEDIFAGLMGGALAILTVHFMVPQSHAS